MVAAARQVMAERPRLSLRKLAAQLAQQGYVDRRGTPYPAQSVANMLARRSAR